MFLFLDVANLLSNATEEDIEEYQKSLRKVKNRTSTDLQQNVYQNRTQFIKISQEADKLKGEMRTLRTLMSELTTALGQTSIGNSPNPMSPTVDERLPKRNANRSSVANLESMWNVQLQTLWKTVEGSQKFLPVVPGRHIVMETGHWVELDSATWKPRRPVHIVLLNDHLLVAAKKRKRVDQSNPNHRGPIPTKLVAEECWPLQDVDMIDLGANLGPGVSREEAEQWCRANKVMQYVETSAKSGENVERAFLEVAERIYQNIEAGKYDLNDRRSGVKGPGAGGGVRGLQLSKKDNSAAKTAGSRAGCC